MTAGPTRLRDPHTEPRAGRKLFTGQAADPDAPHRASATRAYPCPRERACPGPDNAPVAGCSGGAEVRVDAAVGSYAREIRSRFTADRAENATDVPAGVPNG